MASSLPAAQHERCMCATNHSYNVALYALYVLSYLVYYLLPTMYHLNIPFATQHPVYSLGARYRSCTTHSRCVCASHATPSCAREHRGRTRRPRRKRSGGLTCGGWQRREAMRKPPPHLDCQACRAAARAHISASISGARTASPRSHLPPHLPRSHLGAARGAPI